MGGQETLQSLSAPDKVETSIGTLEFKDGAPTADTAKSIYDKIDFTRALNVYNNSFRGASALALVKGFQSIGAGRGVRAGTDHVVAPEPGGGCI